MFSLVPAIDDLVMSKDRGVGRERGEQTAQGGGERKGKKEGEGWCVGGLPVAVFPGQVESLECSSVIAAVPFMQTLAEMQTCNQHGNKYGLDCTNFQVFSKN